MKQTTLLDGKALKKLLFGGLSCLELHKKEVDELNVFPVPDGDTGTNMSMTLKGGAGAVRELEEESVSGFMNAFSRGTLLGARGNSGVILSQFVKGLANGMEGRKTISTEAFKDAFLQGVQKAYDAVLNPTEGTMLTVLKDGGAFLETSPEASFEKLFADLIRCMEASLARTPELLPVLKESGVVDSGGAGIVYLFRGMEKALNGEDVSAEGIPEAEGASHPDFSAFTSDSILEYGYCTEFILRLMSDRVDTSSFDKNEIVDYLKQNGESIVAVQDEDILKIHVHTFRPGEILNFCQKFGEFLTVKIENMSLQHNETMRKTIRKKIAIVAALSGEGIRDCFLQAGVDLVVDGGQTQNPSAEDFLDAFRQIEADHLIVLPCNSNIVLTAQQAAAMKNDADIRVVKAKTVAEGYAALSMMNLSLSIDEVIADMEKAIAETETGLITTATRDVEMNGLHVKKGHFIGLSRESILSDSLDRVEAAEKLLAATKGIREKAVLVIFYGRNVNQEETEKLEERIKTDFPWLEYGFIDGRQDVYDYIFAAE